MAYQRGLEPVPWFMTPKTHFKLLECLSEIHEQNNGGPINHQLLEDLYDQVRSLPGYPQKYSNSYRYEIVPIVDSAGVY